MKRLIFILLLAQMASAFTVKYSVDDYNTLQPIEGASIAFQNSSMLISNVTDIHGEGIIAVTTAAYYTVTISRSGYSNYQSFNNDTNSSEYNVYLSPSSHEGIIRLTPSDLTFAQHRLCVYFTDNGRLQGCYDHNDTITLHTNLNYTIVPMIEKTDIFLNPKGIDRYSNIYIGVAAAAVILVMFVSMIVLIILTILRRKK